MYLKWIQPNDTTFFIIITITILSIASETIIAKLYTFLFTGAVALHLNLALFISGILVFSVAQVPIFIGARKSTKELLSIDQHKLRIAFTFGLIIQFCLTALLSIVSWQILADSHYTTNIVLLAISLAYGSAAINLSFLSKLFIKWLINTKSYVSLFFGLSTIGILISTVLTVLFVGNVLYSQPNEVRFHVGQMTQAFLGYSQNLLIAYSISSVISYVITWSATIFVLRNYSEKIGKISFWLLMCLPMLYVLAQFQGSFLPLFYNYLAQNSLAFSIAYSLFFSIIRFSGAILFGIGFFVMARKVQQKSLRRFLMFSAYGLILAFSSNQAALLLNTAYPPIGLSAVCFVALSSFLLLTGTFSSALSISSDIRIRKSIRASVTKELELLGNIGQAEVNLQLEKKVESMTKILSARLNKDTGVESSLTLEDIKEYTNQAIEEVKRIRSPK